MDITLDPQRTSDLSECQSWSVQRSLVEATVTSLFIWSSHWPLLRLLSAINATIASSWKPQNIYVLRRSLSVRSTIYVSFSSCILYSNADRLNGVNFFCTNYRLAGLCFFHIEIKENRNTKWITKWIELGCLFKIRTRRITAFVYPFEGNAHPGEPSIKQTLS